MNKYFVEKDIIKSFIKSIVIIYCYIDLRFVVNINSRVLLLQKSFKKVVCVYKKKLEYEFENWSINFWEYVFEIFYNFKI